MRIQSKLMALAVISTLAVPLAGCGSSPGSDLEAAFYLFALPIYAIACAGGGCRGSDSGVDLKERAHQRELEQQAEAEQLRIKQELKRRQLEAEAEAGNADAQWDLANSDRGASSWKWLCRSADQGHEFARLEIARQFWYGIAPTPADHVRGYMWYRLAATGGPIRGEMEVAQREADLTADQIAQAERMLEDWRPGQCETTLRLVQSEDSSVGSIAVTSDRRSCTNPVFADLPQCREWLAAWNAAHTEGRPPPSPEEPLQGTATAMPSTPSYNAPASPAQPTTPPPARIAAPSTAPSGQGFTATPQTGTPVGNTPSAPVVDPVGRCAPSVRHLGGSYCATDPNRI